MIEVRVELGERSYPIFIGDDLMTDRDLMTDKLQSKQVLVVSNETVAPLYLERVMRCFEGHNVAEVILPDGEQYKTLETFNLIISALLERRFDRSCTLVALGGGVVGDITGFAAASYQRGVNFIQIPTTLLAQVDSSVGGKTAVNHALGKNMVGAFHQPRQVIADISSLHTLSRRELRAGVAEVIKYGLISDIELFEWLEAHIEALLNLDSAAVSYVVKRSCENKASIVAQDEREGGVRALLNLGHTFGHGIENVYGYGNWLHGEAVACGMCMAADLSARFGVCSERDHERIIALTERAGLPTELPNEVDPLKLEAAMRVDKKNRDGKIRLVLLRGIGQAYISDDYPQTPFKQALGAVAT